MWIGKEDYESLMLLQSRRYAQMGIALNAVADRLDAIEKRLPTKLFAEVATIGPVIEPRLDALRADMEKMMAIQSIFENGMYKSFSGLGEQVRGNHAHILGRLSVRGKVNGLKKVVSAHRKSASS